jgi:hypothetical protein
MRQLRFIIGAGLFLLRPAQASFWYPDATSLLEEILVQTHGAFNSGFVDAITPRTNYVSGAQTTGRETATQWVKVAFYDFVTANVAAGTGGTDASVGLEKDHGASVNDALAFFKPYVNVDVSSK